MSESESEFQFESEFESEGTGPAPREQGSLFSLEPDPWTLDAEDDYWLAKVVFSEPPFGPYDYRIPDAFVPEKLEGRRIAVPLGRGGRQVCGWCVQQIHCRSVAERYDPQKLKSIVSLIDAAPLLTRELLDLAQWLSEYYVAPVGQVIETLIPAGVRSGAGTRAIPYHWISDLYRNRWSDQRLSPQQRELLEYVNRFDLPVPAHQILQETGLSSSPLQTLIKRGLLATETRRMHTHEHVIAPEDREQPLQLNLEQRRALDTILESVEARRATPILLHGVTGSGKTEVYLQAIEAVIRSGRQAIVLVPEISLTPQTRQRFRRRFARVAVLHSQLTDPQRHWYWQQIAEGRVDVVIGTRSAIFAPTPRLGIVIIDEEHDGSFKQDKSPRYHARAVAIRRCQSLGVPLVLGSATPAIETYYAARNGGYLYLSMPNRAEERPLPVVSVVDMRVADQPGLGHRALSRPLLNAMQQTLQDDGQIILLLNRRGFSTCIQCPSCGEVVKCRDCDLALTHHRDSDLAVCHFCDYQVPAPDVCPACHFKGIKFSGLGTQKLEAEVRRVLPDVSLLRMDTDTMRKPGSHEDALQRFRDREIQILLGTQMIAKGLDFPNVTLVGVVNADTGLHMPDFRARERVFGLVTQVAGRTGRGPKGGRVIVQTLNPTDPAIEAAATHDYLSFAAQEIETRRPLGYPPFRQMVRVVVRSHSEMLGEKAAEALGDAVQAEADRQGLSDFLIIGPATAPVTKLRGYYRFHFLILAATSESIGTLIQAATQPLELPDQVQWIVDIDAIDMM